MVIGNKGGKELKKENWCLVKSATSDDPVLFHVDPVEELSNTQRKRKGPATRNDFVNDIVNDAIVDDGI